MILIVSPQMDENKIDIKNRMIFIDDLLTKLEKNENYSVISILEDEIKALNNLNIDYKKKLENKKVYKKEETNKKIRYYLNDGSVYFIKPNEYRYLYDAQTQVVTYEFNNGQIERTFPNGLKEIRGKDGSVVIKHGMKDYDYFDNKICK